MGPVLFKHFGRINKLKVQALNVNTKNGYSVKETNRNNHEIVQRAKTLTKSEMTI
jgi:hypothetical protein